MAFLESRISDRITAETEFEVEHPSRIKLYTTSGKLEQVFGDSPPRHVVNLALGVRNKADFQELVDAFYVVLFTPYTGLRVKNWQDYQATQTNSRCTLITGSTTVLQLQRTHVFGGITFLQDIKKPTATPAAVVWRTRTGVASAIAATIDITTGLATISGHLSGDTYAWVGEFDLPMTFVDSRWRARLEVSTQNLHLVNEPIMMEEILL